jgi:hypothetical protein
MLEDDDVELSTSDRVRASWLTPPSESYLEWLQAHGYSRLVVYRRPPLLFHFAEFAQKKARKAAEMLLLARSIYIRSPSRSGWSNTGPKHKQPQHGANIRSMPSVVCGRCYSRPRKNQ